MTDKYLEKLKEMDTGPITDSLRLLGLDGWMMGVHPVNMDSKICGRAFTIQYGMATDPTQKTYNYYTLLDEIEPGDVIILACGGCPCAIMGSNMQHASKIKDAAGIILDGCNRDTKMIHDYSQPVFTKGQETQFMPPNFKPLAYQIPVSCAGAAVQPGDYIVGDADGVVCISQNTIADVLYQAERIVEIENNMYNAMESGASMQDCLGIISQKGKKRD